MSYFNDVEVSKEFDMGGGDFDPIPNNTLVKAMIENAEWSSYEGSDYINIKWSVLGGDYNNRKLFQKIRVQDDDPKKAEKALRMLAAIDANAGGKLVASGLEPDDFALTSCLCNKAMMLQLATWAMNGKEGNWVKSVSASSGNKAPTPAPAATKAPAAKKAAAKAPSMDSFDDDIPF
jgi:hypothetical protein